MSTNAEEKALEMINGWISANRFYLKDGHRGGIHPRPKAELVKLIAEAMEGAKPAKVARPTKAKETNLDHVMALAEAHASQFAQDTQDQFDIEAAISKADPSETVSIKKKASTKAGPGRRKKAVSGQS